jgi:hypothetical protein
MSTDPIQSLLDMEFRDVGVPMLDFESSATDYFLKALPVDEEDEEERGGSDLTKKRR